MSNNIDNNFIRKRSLENVVVIWLDNSSVDMQERSIDMLHRIFNDIYTFTDPDACIDFVTTSVNEHVFLIIGDDLGQQIIPLIHNVTQFESIYIFCSNSASDKKWIEEFRKVRNVFNNMICLCEQLRADQQFTDKNLIGFHVISSASSPSTPTDKKQNKNKQDATFMVAQLVQDTILKTRDNNKEEMINYCSTQFAGNSFELKIIDEFKCTYMSTKAIWWYTRNSFLYKMINKALRVQDVETLYKMRTFIRDLHSQVSDYYQVQHLDRAEIRCLYRGQCRSKSEFNKLQTNVGGLLSITNFFSTSASRQVALMFAGDSNEESIAIVFEIHLDLSTTTSNPFACIENESHFGDAEHEWLFSMGSIFRIEQIEQHEDTKYYIVHVSPSKEKDEELNELSQLLQPKLEIPNPIAVLGLLLIQLGKNDMAAAFYETALQLDIEPWMRSSLLINLADSYINLVQYDKALVFLHQSLEIKLQFVPSNHWSLSTVYSNLGSVYIKLGKAESAFKYYEQALEIDLANQNPDYNKIATRILNLGSAYFKIDEKEKALKYYQRALSIMLKHLPSNHPNLAVVYNSLSTLYYTQNNFEESLSMSRKSLDIRSASVPEEHPSLAESYMNIAITLLKFDDKEEEALENCQKAVQIANKAFGKDHPTTKRYQQILDDIFINIADDTHESD